jgi:hypothetical protein
MIPLHNGLILGHEYHVVEVNDVSIIYKWLIETFGPAGKRWFSSNTKIYFRDEKDWMWFELRT